MKRKNKGNDLSLNTAIIVLAIGVGVYGLYGLGFEMLVYIIALVVLFFTVSMAKV